MCIWAKTKKKLVENLWVDTCDHGLANSFLDIVQRISKKRKINCTSSKLKMFFLRKHNRVRRQAAEWDKLF